MNRLVILLIKIYRKVISPYLPATCRFTPTCSVYASQAFQKYNFFKAIKLSVLRILKCHPFHAGGNDPLP
ncbi:MAG: membrane protein insertion efficiency factor YidD [Candidatus Cloacimonadota bacterium]|nr:membrane protein insertion efficiency factor YidD [Candidatus Cloacimonadota bacterium]